MTESHVARAGGSKGAGALRVRLFAPRTPLFGAWTRLFLASARVTGRACAAESRVRAAFCRGAGTESRETDASVVFSRGKKPRVTPAVPRARGKKPRATPPKSNWMGDPPSSPHLAGATRARVGAFA